MRRSTIFKGVQQESETAARLLVAESERAENRVLNIPAVNTNRSRPELGTVKHQVVRFRTAARRIRGELFDIVVMNGCERMMRGIPAFFLFVPLEHRKIDHP